MGSRKEVKRKGRTGAFTIEEMMNSQRFKIAVDYFNVDKSFMRAMLIELIWECTNVVRSTLVKRYACASDLSAFEMIPYLRATDEFDTWNLWFSMSEIEQKIYQTDPKHKLTEPEREELLKKLHHQLMESGSQPTEPS